MNGSGMTSKQRVGATLDHRQPDRVPVDFGSTFVSGVHVSCVAALRDYFGLEKRLVKAIELLLCVFQHYQPVSVPLGHGENSWFFHPPSLILSITRRGARLHPHLSPADLEGDLHTLCVQEIAHLAYQSARMQSARKAEKQLQQLRGLAGTKRISSDIRQIVSAAEEGRIAKLFLAEGAEFGATLEALESESPEDLLNAAAVLSIRNGAEMFMLPAETMGPEAPIAAVFRY